MLAINNLSVQFTGTNLFENVTFNIGDRDRIGLVPLPGLQQNNNTHHLLAGIALHYSVSSHLRPPVNPKTRVVLITPKSNPPSLRHARVSSKAGIHLIRWRTGLGSLFV